MKLLQKPKKLCPGDKVAAVSLSWGGAAAFPDRYACGKKFLQDQFGLEVVESRHALRDPAWLAANPKARADDLMEAFADPSIKGIFSIIGGDDSVRMEPFVDLNVIRSNPKVFMGYSDTTVSHFMCLKAGLSSFYGPSILAEFAENGGCFAFTAEAVRRTLFCTEPLGAWEPERTAWTGHILSWGVPENRERRRPVSAPLGPRFLQGSGTVEGPLLGGCIEVLEMLRATPLWPGLDVWKDAVLFLETSEERPAPDLFRRWLRGYASMGILPIVKAVLLGRPMSGPGYEEMTAYDAVLQSVVREECGLKDLPLVTQLDFGHSDPQGVLPIGQPLRIDCDRRVLSLPEPAVLPL